jgi:hypothetical protein
MHNYHPHQLHVFIVNKNISHQVHVKVELEG